MFHFLRDRARALVERAKTRLHNKFYLETLYGYGQPYLTRYQLLVFNRHKLRLHHIHRADGDREHHNHVRWMVSLILRGGYTEHRRRSVLTPLGHYFEIDTKECLPLSVNLLSESTYHRIDELHGDCWTLVLCGPAKQPWDFWSPTTGAYTPWRIFVAEREAAQPTRTDALHLPPEVISMMLSEAHGRILSIAVIVFIFALIGFLSWAKTWKRKPKRD
jgi:hypothetical protein